MFRQFRKEAEIIQNLKMEWSQKMKDRFKAKLTEKQAVAMQKEENRLGVLEELRESGGPFTCSEQVDTFMSQRKQLEESTVGKKAKDAIRKETKGRMKLEMKFARDSSKTLPKSDDIFRIQVTGLNKKRRDKTAEEFSVALKAYYGKKVGRVALSLDTFKKVLNNISKSV